MVKKLWFLYVVTSLLLAACGGAAADAVEAIEARELPTAAEVPLEDEVSEDRTDSPLTELEQDLSAAQDSYDIITLLPPDAIPSIDNPRFVSASAADEQYLPDEPVIGIELAGEARAYSTALLSSHEIVNDMIGGRPIAVTW